MQRLTLLLVGEPPVTLDPLAQWLTRDGYRVLRSDRLAATSSHPIGRDLDVVVVRQAHHYDANVRRLALLRAGALKLSPITPVLWITATPDPGELVLAFDAGADDVVRQPASYAELHARIRALLTRRRVSGPPLVIRYRDLQIDSAARQVTLAGKAIRLPAQEYALLIYLALDPGRVHSRRELLRDIWGYQSPPLTRTVDAHAARLRRRLADAGAAGWISGVRSVGYRLAPDP